MAVADVPTMRVYYLEAPLTDEELSAVAEMLECDVTQLRIPHVLPARDSEVPLLEELAESEEAATKLLQSAGIMADYGRRVALVIPGDNVVYSALSEAIFRFTGYYPFVVQTAGHRDAIGNPGGIRIIDMHGMMSDGTPG